MRHKYRPRNNELLDEWPELKGEKAARFSFLSVWEKPLPRAPTPGTPSYGPPSPGLLSPGLLSPGLLSPGLLSPGLPSPGLSSHGPPSPGPSSLNSPTPSAGRWAELYQAELPRKTFSVQELEGSQVSLVRYAGSME
jgi:hypothetical protein